MPNGTSTSIKVIPFKRQLTYMALVKITHKYKNIIMSNFLSTNVYKAIDEFPTQFTGDMVMYHYSVLLIQVTYLVTVPGKKYMKGRVSTIPEAKSVAQLSLGYCPNPVPGKKFATFASFHVLKGCVSTICEEKSIVQLSLGYCPNPRTMVF